MEDTCSPCWSSWLPSASQSELDTAQAMGWHRLQGCSLALPKPVGKHRGIAADAVREPWKLMPRDPIFPRCHAVHTVIPSHLEKEKGTPF